MKNKEDIFTRLHAIKDELACFGVARVGLFGSYARDTPRPNSDIDLLVEFHHTPSLLELAELHLKLEELLACRVDIATKEMLSKDLRDAVLDEVVYHD
ncbi:MAG: nucleotidyltransferase domain-containing protein [Methylocystaceae bacterium]|nr:nucleotidyltransferase domain-containing protein [Methylocystaceae bacterium]